MLMCGLAIAIVPVPIVPFPIVPDYGAATTRPTHWGEHPAIALENRHVTAVVVPNLGRLMVFGPREGPNLLWTQRQPAVDTWRNYGGDKAWVAPQSIWNWPPEPAHDGQPHRARHGNGAIVLESNPSAVTRTSISRTFRLQGRTLTIDQTLTKSGGDAVAIALWQVLQLPIPRRIDLPYSPSPRFPNGFSVYGDTRDEGQWRRNGTTLSLTPSLNRDIKYGLAAPAGRLTAVFDRYRVTLSAPFDPDGTYPDDGKAQQIYVATGLRYIELEVTAPLATLQSNQSQSLRTQITFDRLPDLN
jgi:hypothetical protein